MRVSQLRPTYSIESFGSLRPEVLKEEHPEIRGLTHDIDGYLANYHGSIVPWEHVRVIKSAHEAGFIQAIITNAGGERLERAEDIVGKIKAMAEVEGMEIPIVSSGMPGMQKKPDTSMFEHAAELLGLKPEEMCHGGDQLLKDVYGANRAGYGATILTERYGYSDHAGVRFIQRPLEAMARPVLGIAFAETM